MTVVLSEKGWVRAAKGHDIDAASLSYRDGDSLLGAVKARSNLQVAFLDSAGRSYSSAVHTLPSARGNGEPLTGRFTPAPGASFQALASGDLDARFVIASSHGYGFVTRFDAVISRNKAGARQGQGHQDHRNPEGQARHRARGRDRGGAAVRQTAGRQRRAHHDPVLQRPRRLPRRPRFAWRPAAARMAEGGWPGRRDVTTHIDGETVGRFP